MICVELATASSTSTTRSDDTVRSVTSRPTSWRRYHQTTSRPERSSPWANKWGPRQGGPISRGRTTPKLRRSHRRDTSDRSVRSAQRASEYVPLLPFSTTARSSRCRVTASNSGNSCSRVENES
jgi:hypothetical protein